MAQQRATGMQACPKKRPVRDRCEFFPFTRKNIWRGGWADQYQFAIKRYTLCKNPQVPGCLEKRANFFWTTHYITEVTHGKLPLINLGCAGSQNIVCNDNNCFVVVVFVVVIVIVIIILDLESTLHSLSAHFTKRAGFTFLLGEVCSCHNSSTLAHTYAHGAAFLLPHSPPCTASCDLHHNFY